MNLPTYKCQVNVINSTIDGGSLAKSLPMSCDFGSDLELMRKNVERVSKKYDFLELKLFSRQFAVQSSSVQFSFHLNCSKVQQFRATRVE